MNYKIITVNDIDEQHFIISNNKLQIKDNPLLVNPSVRENVVATMNEIIARYDTSLRNNAGKYKINPRDKSNDRILYFLNNVITNYYTNSGLTPNTGSDVDPYDSTTTQNIANGQYYYLTKGFNIEQNNYSRWFIEKFYSQQYTLISGQGDRPYRETVLLTNKMFVFHQVLLNLACRKALQDLKAGADTSDNADLINLIKYIVSNPS